MQADDVKTALKNLCKHFLLQNQVRVSRATDFDQLENFFRSIQPITTNHNLIRIGGESDGGYLIPDDLDDVDICFSPGVSNVADFELALASRGIKCFLADYSVDSAPVEHSLFRFDKKYLGNTDNQMCMTLESWVNRYAPDQNELILQMDIEGSEYSVLHVSSLELLRKFRIMTVEFHKLDALCDRFGFEFISLTFSKLLHVFDVVHIHPNNYHSSTIYGKYQIPPVVEFTFLRKDRILSRRPTTAFPHPLDRKNVPHRDDFPLPECWYKC